MMTSKKICVLGNFSGRNAGDAAILAGILRDVSSRYSDVEFLVPTLNPRFIRRTYGQYRVQPISVAPWRGCIKFLGLQVWHALRSSHLILITDAILFDRGLFNPVHNYLSTLALWIPQAKKRNIPVVLYNVSLGPVSTRAGRWCLKQVLENSELVILRDEESKKVLESMEKIPASILEGADSALSAPACSAKDAEKILKKHGLLDKSTPRVGINLNCYGDAFVRHGQSSFTQDKLVSIVAKAAEWIHHDLKADVWLFGTQHMDVKILKQLQQRVGIKAPIPLFTNQEYSFAELTGLFSQLDLLIGMRTHSTILATSVGTPVVGIIAYPKTYGYLQRIGQEGQTIPIQALELEKLQQLVRTTWEQRKELRHNILHAVEQERLLAQQAASFLMPYLVSE